MEKPMSMQFPEPYNPENTGGGYEPLPPGEYIAQAIEATIAPPKSGNGLGLTLVWKVLEGEHEGRQIWENISFLHPKAGAQWHGQKMLNAIIAATGAPTPLQSAEPLLFVPCRIGIAIETDKDGVYPDKNRITKVSPLGNNETAEASPSPAPAPKPTPAAAAVTPPPAGTVPWRKK
jgi:hypothetical protein